MASYHDIKFREDNFVQKNEGWDNIEEENMAMNNENFQGNNDNQNGLNQLVSAVPVV